MKLVVDKEDGLSSCAVTRIFQKWFSRQRHGVFARQPVAVVRHVVVTLSVLWVWRLGVASRVGKRRAIRATNEVDVQDWDGHHWNNRKRCLSLFSKFIVVPKQIMMLRTFLGFIINTKVYHLGRYNLHLLLIKSSMTDRINAKQTVGQPWGRAIAFCTRSCDLMPDIVMGIRSNFSANDNLGCVECFKLIASILTCL